MRFTTVLRESGREGRPGAADVEVVAAGAEVLVAVGAVVAVIADEVVEVAAGDAVKAEDPEGGTDVNNNARWNERRTGWLSTYQQQRLPSPTV